jgi:hypothetical protein
MGVTPGGLGVTNVLQPPRISSGHRRTTMTTPHCLTQSYANGHFTRLASQTIAEMRFYPPVGEFILADILQKTYQHIVQLN